MVLSTLHTNSAASTPMRLVEMGIEPFLVTSSLSGVLAQRLARRLCMHCKETYEPTEADIAAAGWTSRGRRRSEAFPGLPGGRVLGMRQHGLPGSQGPGSSSCP